MTGSAHESTLESGSDPSRASDVAAATEWPEGLAALLTGAAEQARAAVAEFSGEDAVGEYLGVGYEDPTTATHRFLANLAGYQGWQWVVVVASYEGAARATISEVVLVPGPTALLAPEWVPWDQRVRPGDLNPGDLLAPAKDDPRLVPGYTSSGDPEVDEVEAEVGLGRRWVMGPWGRADAAERWHEGDYGPDSAMSRSTKRVCRDCGFFLPLAGSLGAMFGVCGNELSADGHVVDKQYGCGAHSDTPAPAGTGSPIYDPFDDGVLEVVEAAVAAPPQPPAETGLAESAEEPLEPAEQPLEPADVSPAESGEQPVAEAVAVVEPVEAVERQPEALVEESAPPPEESAAPQEEPPAPSA